jgi:uncharacterized protein YgbK (DUF1537 family)
MQTAQRKEVDVVDEVDVVNDRELQELNRLMLRATWEAGLPTASGVADALAEQPTRRKSAKRTAVGAAVSPR